MHNDPCGMVGEKPAETREVWIQFPLQDNNNICKYASICSGSGFCGTMLLISPDTHDTAIAILGFRTMK